MPGFSKPVGREMADHRTEVTQTVVVADHSEAPLEPLDEPRNQATLVRDQLQMHPSPVSTFVVDLPLEGLVQARSPSTYDRTMCLIVRLVPPLDSTKQRLTSENALPGVPTS